MARTERESDRRKREEKWQTLWCCRDQQRACRMAQASAEKLEQTGPAEKERVASEPQRQVNRLYGLYCTVWSILYSTVWSESTVYTVLSVQARSK